MNVKKGDKIRIIYMNDDNGRDLVAKRMTGKTGTVTSIDDTGLLHGTWGGLAILPDIDEIEVINENVLSESFSNADEWSAAVDSWDGVYDDEAEFIQLNTSAQKVLFWHNYDIGEWIEDFDEDPNVIDDILSMEVGEVYNMPDGINVIIRIKNLDLN